jgi:hypothetical protein
MNTAFFDEASRMLAEAGYELRSGMGAHLYHVTDSKERTSVLRKNDAGEWICNPINHSNQNEADRILEIAMGGYTPQIDPLILNILCIHVFAVEFLALTLASMSQNATGEDWLTLAYANGVSRARDSTTGELENVWGRAIQVAKGQPHPPDESD